MRDLSNEELLVKYQEAEKEAFQVFYERHKNLIMSFLMTKLRNTTDAEEAFQETFFRIHRFILKYDPKQSSLGWVFTIAKNAAIDVMAKNQRLAQLKTARAQETSHEDVAGSSQLVVEARQELQDLLSRLSPEEQELIKYRFIDGESYEEIAARLEIKTDTTRQKLSRLLRRIKGVEAGRFKS